VRERERERETEERERRGREREGRSSPLKKRRNKKQNKQALFSFEGVIADTRAAQAEAWRRVSSRRALAWPPPEVSLWGSGSGGGGEESPFISPPAPSAPSAPASNSSRLLPPRVALVCSLRPERAITEVLQWTRDYGLASKIAAEVAHEYLAIVRGDDDDDDGVSDAGAVAAAGASATGANEKVPKPFFSSPRPGVARWLAALRSARVPCAVVTSLDRRTLLSALERMGLLHDDLLLAPSAAASFVTAEDGAESLAHSLLAGALKLGRPPNACCAFVASPSGVAAAHNASMRAVAVVTGEHSSHDLRSADATVTRLDELAVIQVRRLFSSSPEGTPGAFMGKQKERAPGAGGGEMKVSVFLGGPFFGADNGERGKRTLRIASLSRVPFSILLLKPLSINETTHQGPGATAAGSTPTPTPRRGGRAGGGGSPAG
jgi:beta-phosphoglucomutase-like phosphatase (HAD superfamily)